ncbi:MAG: alpha/beta hydrolase [Ruminococcus sp.]|nr:alpha/beta hydrolase [Ruminococcus sp.]
MMIHEKIYDLYLPYRGAQKRVRVFVPEHEENETLPVIYMTDGQNLFEDDAVQFGCWYTREAVRAERAATGMAAMIVGIFNDDGEKERTGDLTPKTIGALLPREELKGVTPRGEEFDAFVVSTVMPAVEARFPVEKGRNATAFCGSSSGGLQSFFTALSHPDLFCAAGVFSPAFLLYAPEDMRRWIDAAVRDKMPYLFLYTGAGDPLEQDIYESVEWTYDLLLERYPMHLLNEIVLPEERHHEKAWAPMFRDFLHTFLARRAD